MSERKAVLDAVVDEARGRVPVIAGIVEYSTKAAIEFGAYAQAAVLLGIESNQVLLGGGAGVEDQGQLCGCS